MRLAKSNDIWRGLFKPQKRSLETIRFSYRESEQGPTLSLSIDAPVALLCGENGVGKSQALRALHAAFGGSLSPIDFRPLAGPRPSHVDLVQATIRRKEVETEDLGGTVELDGIDAVSAELRDENGESKIFRFDPTLQIPYLLHLLRHDSSLSDLWEGVSPKNLTTEELEEISALVGRSYSSVEFFEITDYQHHEVIPYFRVKSNAETYGAEDMGLGELSLLFFYWTLTRLSHGAVLLLEEPETFVAPKSQRHMIDLIALSASEKGTVSIIASHSGIIAERVPGSHVYYVSRTGQNVSFIRNPARNILADRLALVPPKSVVALLEDSAGVMLARALLEAGNSKYLSHCTLLIAGGESEITTTLNNLKPSEVSGNVVIFGIYDGDQRKKIPKNSWWPTLCLVGDKAPEHTVKEWLYLNKENLAQLLNRENDVVLAAIAAVDGQNHHDWLIGFSRIIQISIEELFRRVARGLLTSAPDQVRNFISEFDKKSAEVIQN